MDGTVRRPSRARRPADDGAGQGRQNNNQRNRSLHGSLPPVTGGDRRPAILQPVGPRSTRSPPLRTLSLALSLEMPDACPHGLNRRSASKWALLGVGNGFVFSHRGESFFETRPEWRRHAQANCSDPCRFAVLLFGGCSRACPALALRSRRFRKETGSRTSRACDPARRDPHRVARWASCKRLLSSHLRRTKSWMERHPVWFGLIVGAGVGAAWGAASCRNGCFPLSAGGAAMVGCGRSRRGRLDRLGSRPGKVRRSPRSPVGTRLSAGCVSTRPADCLIG